MIPRSCEMKIQDTRGENNDQSRSSILNFLEKILDELDTEFKEICLRSVSDSCNLQNQRTTNISENLTTRNIKTNEKNL